MPNLNTAIKTHARQLGFHLVGITTPAPPESFPAYKAWIKAGHHGEMGYLATDRALARRADPRAILPECRSILLLGIPYNNPPPQPAKKGQGRTAAYAWNDDYHDILKPRLQALVEFIEKETGQPIPNRWYTDTGPILERDLASRAGLGWIGKNSMLISPKVGSTFLLAEILLGIDLDPDPPFTTDHCGTCTACIDACPTDCILPNRTLDARRCISTLTIELKGPIPPDLRPLIGDWVFGCDICQQVCPWNIRFAPPEGAPVFDPRPNVPHIDLQSELALTPEEFNKKFKGSPIKRAKRRGYLRNVSVALGNAGDPASVPALVETLGDAEALVRGHAAWALGQIGGEEAIQALQDALNQEKDKFVLQEIEQALA